MPFYPPLRIGRYRLTFTDPDCILPFPWDPGSLLSGPFLGMGPVLKYSLLLSYVLFLLPPSMRIDLTQISFVGDSLHQWSQTLPLLFKRQCSFPILPPTQHRPLFMKKVMPNHTRPSTPINLSPPIGNKGSRRSPYPSGNRSPPPPPPLINSGPPPPPQYSKIRKFFFARWRCVKRCSQNAVGPSDFTPASPCQNYLI